MHAWKPELPVLPLNATKIAYLPEGRQASDALSGGPPVRIAS
jgi:hypothetical protein